MPGWLVFACAGIVLGSDPFTVVLLPDTQKYTQQSPEDNRYSAQTSWIKSNAEAENIEFMIHLGDIVQTGTPILASGRSLTTRTKFWKRDRTPCRTA